MSPSRFIFTLVSRTVAILPLSTLASAAPVILQQGTATFSQTQSASFSPDQVYDGNFGNLNGWAIVRAPQGVALSETAVWESTADIGPGVLTFVTHSNHLTNSQHMMGRFRFSVTTDDRSEFADDLDSGGDVSANWHVLGNPSVSFLPPGMAYTVLPDSSILTHGAVPDTGMYVIRYSSNLAGVTGIRLEVLEHESLPHDGPGYHSGNGNFHLTEMTIDIAEAVGSAVAWWRFEEGVGNTTLDSSGNGNTATLLNGAAFSMDVPVPRVRPDSSCVSNTHSLILQSDPPGQAVAIPDAPSLRPRDAITIETFIRPEPGARVVIAKQILPQCCANSYTIELLDDSTILHFILSDSTASQSTCGERVSLSGYHHVAGTWDGTTMRLYLDYQEISACPFAGPIAYDDHPVLIGADDDGGGSPGCCFFLGGIDEVRISDVALMPGQFLQLCSVSATSGGDQAPIMPGVLALDQAHPNPFTAHTTIPFALPMGASIHLAIYDGAGRLVRTLISGSLSPGFHSSEWDGTDGGNHAVASGVYFYRLEFEGKVFTRKLVITR